MTERGNYISPGVIQTSTFPQLYAVVSKNGCPKWAEDKRESWVALCGRLYCLLPLQIQGIPFVAKIWAIRAAVCLAGWQLSSACSDKSAASVSFLIAALCKQSIREQKAFKEALGGLCSLECSVTWIRQAGHKFPLVRESIIAPARGGSCKNRLRR